ncbi:MAG: hypothetical protein U0840_05155 [Gemmataceae bacterium]
MQKHLLWSLGGLGLLAVLAASVQVLPGLAQPRPDFVRPMVGPGPQVGRFVVAQSNDTRIVILDTATGQLYAASADDFKKHRDIPRPPEPGAGRPGERDRDGRRPDERTPPGEEGRQPPPRRDGDRRDKDRREEDRRDKERPKEKEDRRDTDRPRSDS